MSIAWLKPLKHTCVVILTSVMGYVFGRCMLDVVVAALNLPNHLAIALRKTNDTGCFFFVVVAVAKANELLWMNCIIKCFPMMLP